MQLSKNSISSDLLTQLCDSLDRQYGATGAMPPIVPWAESLVLDGQPFTFKDHEYQRDMIKEDATQQVFLKGAQIGATSIVMLKTLYGLISRRYPQGCLYLFPSREDVLDFSRGRFNPLINDNKQISRYVQDTDSVTIKRIGEAMLYLRGARSTANIQGIRRTSSQLKSIPTDRNVYDEMDNMAPDMIDLARERLSHSRLQEEVFLSTPSIPDFGVDLLFQGSDQRYWEIKCSKCGKGTILELEFPACLEELADGRVIRLCQRCRDNEIHPRDGRWVAMCPDRAKDMVGWRISQLNSVFMDPGKILALFRDPPGGNITEVYNSKLGQAHIEAENRLTVPEVLKLCGDKPIAESDPGPCYLGADIGSLIHCVIGKHHPHKAGQILYIGAFPDWSHLHTLMNRFNIVLAVIDALPETRLARQFAEKHKGRVFLCYYQEGQKGGYGWNEAKLTVAVNRTEALDASHQELSREKVVLPQESDTLHTFARQCSNLARILQTQPETGSSKYVYIKTGDDHYRHAQSYEAIARGYGASGFFGGLDLS